MTTEARPPTALLDPAAAFAADPAGDWALLPPLPASVALQIYNLLTVEERLRAREVSRAWRHVPGGWRCVDLCMTGWRPQHCQRVLGLVTKHVAASSVQSLRVEFPDTLLPTDIIEFRDALTGIANAHSATLRTLDVTFSGMGLSLLDTIFGRCPALESCRLGELRFQLNVLADDGQQLAAVLKGDARYSLIAVRALVIYGCQFSGESLPEAQLCEALEGHRSLRKLSLHGFISSGATGVLARGAARAGVVDFKFVCDDVDDEETFTREVAQLLDGFPVQRLCMEFSVEAEYEYDGLFLKALRNSRSLQTLEFEFADWSDANPDVLQVLVGHPTLTHLRLYSPRWEDSQYFLESLADVLAASSALTQLSLEDAYPFDEDGLRVIIAGLDSSDARLQKLTVLTDNTPLSASFAARVIGPAVLNCASMRELRISEKRDGDLYKVQCRINDLLQFNDKDV